MYGSDVLQHMFGAGFLSAKETVAIRKTARRLAESPVRILRSLNIARPEEIRDFVQKATGVRAITDQSVQALDDSFKALIPIDVALDLAVFAIAEEDDGSLHVAMEDPTDQATIHKLRFFLDRRIVPVVATAPQIIAALTRLYGVRPENIHMASVLEESRGVLPGITLDSVVATISISTNNKSDDSANDNDSNEFMDASPSPYAFQPPAEFIDEDEDAISTLTQKVRATADATPDDILNEAANIAGDPFEPAGEEIEAEEGLSGFDDFEVFSNDAEASTGLESAVGENLTPQPSPLETTEERFDFNIESPDSSSAATDDNNLGEVTDDLGFFSSAPAPSASGVELNAETESTDDTESTDLTDDLGFFDTSSATIEDETDEPDDSINELSQTPEAIGKPASVHDLESFDLGEAINEASDIVETAENIGINPERSLLLDSEEPLDEPAPDSATGFTASLMMTDDEHLLDDFRDDGLNQAKNPIMSQPSENIVEILSRSVNKALVRLSMTNDMRQAVSIINEHIASAGATLSLPTSVTFCLTLGEVRLQGGLQPLDTQSSPLLEAMAPALRRLEKICRRPT